MPFCSVEQGALAGAFARDPSRARSENSSGQDRALSIRSHCLSNVVLKGPTDRKCADHFARRQIIIIAWPQLARAVR